LIGNRPATEAAAGARRPSTVVVMGVAAVAVALTVLAQALSGLLLG
jgi:hypothetical protein